MCSVQIPKETSESLCTTARTLRHGLHYPGRCANTGLSPFWATAWPDCLCRHRWKFQIHFIMPEHEHCFQTFGEHVVRVKRQMEDKSYCKNIFSAYELTCPACVCSYTHAYRHCWRHLGGSAVTGTAGWQLYSKALGFKYLFPSTLLYSGSLSLSDCLDEEERLKISLLHGKFPFAFFF